MQILDDILNLMDKWRHFPNYQLERRADIFFAFYMRDILSINHIRNIVSIIPEFPVRIGEITKHDRINKSYKIDYLVLQEGGKVSFIELKTDRNSRRKKQDEYLEASKNAGFYKLLHGLLKIYSATTAKAKYEALLNELVSAGALSKTTDNEYFVTEQKYHEEIIYIQPVQDNCNESNVSVITFHEIALRLQEKDETAQRFAKSLIQWAELEAGQTNNV